MIYLEAGCLCVKVRNRVAVRANSLDIPIFSVYLYFVSIVHFLISPITALTPISITQDPQTLNPTIKLPSKHVLHPLTYCQQPPTKPSKD